MKRSLIFLAWLVVLGLGANWLLLNLRPAADLTAFLPTQAEGQSALLLDELRDGGATRLILIAIEGDDSSTLAAASKRLARSLRDNPTLLRIDNGQRDDDEDLLAQAHEYRYLLTPNDLTQRLSEAGLRSALQARLRDLGSALEMVVKDLLASDPTHETLAVLESWRPLSEPPRRHGVWFDAEGSRTLLVAETVAPGFDLDGQADAVAALQAAFADLGKPELKLLLTGPGPFGLLLRETTRAEAQLFSSIAVVVLLGFLLLVYRSFPLLILGGLPLATGVLAALLAVQLAFGGIHGITLAFGVTLLGVAIDYPLHLFSHRQSGETAADTMRSIWPTLRLGVLSTCIAYLTLLFSDFPGLAQLGLFTVMGLLVAAACTRWLLPPLLASPAADPGEGLAQRWLGVLNRAHLPVAMPWLLLLTAVVILTLGRDDLWQNDLSTLTPVPGELQAADRQLRQALGAAELRHLLVIEAGEQEAVLQLSEQASLKLDALVKQGLLGGYDQPARYLPSLARQQARQAALPDSATLQQRLQGASTGLPFRAELFTPFVQQVEAARQGPPMDAAIYAESPMAARLDSLLKYGEQGWRALLPLQGVVDAAAIAQALDQPPAIRILDLKSESADMVAGFRGETLLRIALASIAIMLITALALRPRLIAVLLPVFTTVLCEAALFRMAGVPLSLFHLVSLMLVGGIVLDYALFFNRAESAPQTQARTLHALSVCAISTFTVFGILALSEIPVLRAIGVTVAAGVCMGYILSALTAMGDARRKPDDNASTQT